MTTSNPEAHHTESSAALVTGVACYVLWGLFPLYWPLLDRAGALEVLAHRMVWSCVSAGVLLAVLRRPRGCLRALRGGRIWLVLGAAVVISFNWGGYIYAVNAGHVVEASLGYFINPLVSIVLGRLLFGETLSRFGRIGAGMAFAGVVLIAWANWATLWISLLLAFSFGFYGAFKKKVALPALPGLLVESGLMILPSLVYLGWLESTGRGHFMVPGMWWLFMLGGLITMIPLWLFAIAARHLTLGTVGVLQYIAPTIQFLIGVIWFGQQVSAGYWIGLMIVWAGCLVYLWGVVGRARPRRVVSV